MKTNNEVASRTPHDPRRALAASALAAALLSGCASHPAPTLQMAASDAALERAAATAPRFAPRELQLAQTKLDLAKRLQAAREHAPARWLAEQAQVDAELAQARAATAGALREAAQLQDSLRAVTYRSR
jgi:outer membrane murein-binding lipoprotein Lpp